MSSAVMESLRSRLRQPRPFAALFSIIAAVEVVELAALAGFDGVILDTEHGSYGTETLGPLVLAARASGIYPIVRVRSNDASLIGAALDAGAAGVLVPQIGSVAEAVKALSAARFAPEGTRGANPWVRAGGFGFTQDWFSHANEEAAVMLMIEGASGLAALEGIVQLPGLDSIFLGPVDLSHSLGVPGQVNHPKVHDAIASTLRSAKSLGINVGVFAPTELEAARWLSTGAGFVAVGVDTAHLGRAFRQIMLALNASRPNPQ
jgi:4-hydroxy-2-oxoheptanedioate aldolase